MDRPLGASSAANLLAFIPSSADRFTNSKKANGFVREKYRKGWEVDGLG